MAWSNQQKPWLGTQLPLDEIDLALFTAATRVLVNDGRKASFWYSTWMDGRSPASMFPLLHAHSRRKNRSVREALLNGKWIDDVGYDLSSALMLDIYRLSQKISTMDLDLNIDEEDKIVWLLESSGQYSARSAYEIQFSGHIISNFTKLIWKTWATPKCKFFIWLLLQNRIWTAVRLQQRGWANNYFCAFCVRNLETAHHLFVECHHARKVWTLVACGSGCNNLDPSSWSEQEDMELWFMAIATRITDEFSDWAFAKRKPTQIPNQIAQNFCE